MNISRFHFVSSANLSVPFVFIFNPSGLEISAAIHLILRVAKYFTHSHDDDLFLTRDAIMFSASPHGTPVLDRERVTNVVKS